MQWLEALPEDTSVGITGDGLRLEEARDFSWLEVGVIPEGDNTSPTREELTCFLCKENSTCLYAWDDYNTNGDCLAEK